MPIDPSAKERPLTAPCAGQKSFTGNGGKCSANDGHGESDCVFVGDSIALFDEESTNYEIQSLDNGRRERWRDRRKSDRSPRAR